MSNIAQSSCASSLSIVIPVYNESAFLPKLLSRVTSASLPVGVDKQIIVVDDGSTDGTVELLRDLAEQRSDLVVLYHPFNRGKGAALRTGFEHATGDLVVIQDADLEYDPSQLPKLMQPILDDLADVVIGSRFIGECHRVVYYWHALGNKVLTTLSNILTNLNLTDMECCYKMFRRSLLDHIQLREARFGIEPELVAKFAQLNVRMYEVAINYAGRTYGEGKKIDWRDGLSALRCIIRYNLLSRTARH